MDRKKYQTADEIKRDAFALFDQADFNEYNAIITYLDHEGKEVLLDVVPTPLPRGQYRDLFLRLVRTIDEGLTRDPLDHLSLQIHPACALCEGYFGILDDQLLYECPTNKCGEQYCRKCVTTIQGTSNQHPFTCILCRKDVQLTHNTLIEKYLIWPRIGHLYGMENLVEFQSKTESLLPSTIKKDIQFRCLHLQSRLDAYRKKRVLFPNVLLLDEKLQTDVEDMCRQLQQISEHMDQIDETLRDQNIDLNQIAAKHHEMSKTYDALYEQFRIHLNDHNNAELDQSYNTNRLEKLPTARNVESLDQSLRDLNSRKQLLEFYLYVDRRSLSSSEKRSDADLENLLAKGNEQLIEINRLMDELTCVRGHLRAMERRVHDYLRVLADYRRPDVPGARFIYLLESLRRETEKIDVEQHFSRTIRLMNDWYKDLEEQETFKPKVLDLCKAIEEDWQDSLADGKSISTIPYKVGVVGSTSVGKSALIVKLGDFKDFSSMINLERSTFGYLQFDTTFPGEKEIPISFMDIAGATDQVTSKSMGTYLELITKADCDLYLIVFDQPFQLHHRLWLDYIEKTLNRKCLLVRSKIDLAFHTFYSQLVGKKFRKGMYDLYGVRSTMAKLQEYAKTTFDEAKLDREIFLTATDEDNEFEAEEFGRFDFHRLKRKIHHLAAHDHRAVRLANLAMLAAKTAINTCFRRGYLVSKTKYRWLAAGASIIPFLDEIPAFFGREEIRQAFGIHDRSTLANHFQRRKNSLEEYLMAQGFKVPKDSIKSGYFQYLVSDDLPAMDVEKMQSAERNRLAQQIDSAKYFARPGAVGTSVAAAGAFGQVFQHVLRVTAPAASGVLRVASVAGVVVGALLTPVTAAWSFYASGKRMNRHLHLLCDDLQTVFTYFILHLCDEWKQKDAPILSSSSSDEESSSSDPETE